MLHDKMCINIHTREEHEAFIDIAMKEKLRWEHGDRINKWFPNCLPMSVQIGYYNPHKVTYTSTLNYVGEDEENWQIVEAADLFHNQIISRRLKQ